MPPRPTLRCLRDDLSLPLPTARTPLDEIGHPLIKKAAEQFTTRDISHERIASIDDVVLFAPLTLNDLRRIASGYLLEIERAVNLPDLWMSRNATPFAFLEVA